MAVETMTPSQKGAETTRLKKEEGDRMTAAQLRVLASRIEDEIDGAIDIEAKAEARMPGVAFAARDGDSNAIAELASLNSQVVAARNAVSLGRGALVETMRRLGLAEVAEQGEAEAKRAAEAKEIAVELLAVDLEIDSALTALNGMLHTRATATRRLSSFAQGSANRLSSRSRSACTAAMEVAGIMEHVIGLPHAGRGRRATLREHDASILAMVMSMGKDPDADDMEHAA